MARCPLADTLPYVSQAHKWDLGLKMQGTGYPHLEQGQPSHGLEALALLVGGRGRLRVENLGVSGGLSCSPLWQQRTLHGAGWAGVATNIKGHAVSGRTTLNLGLRSGEDAALAHPAAPATGRRVHSQDRAAPARPCSWGPPHPAALRGLLHQAGPQEQTVPQSVHLWVAMEV